MNMNFGGAGTSQLYSTKEDLDNFFNSPTKLSGGASYNTGPSYGQNQGFGGTNFGFGVGMNQGPVTYTSNQGFGSNMNGIFSFRNPFVKYF